VNCSLDAVESRLVELRAREAGTDHGMRTHILDLVVFCDTRAAADEVAEVVANLPYNRPSRAIVALAEGGERPVEFEARVFCSPTGGLHVCSELVLLSAGDGGAALPSLIAGLLLPDLPVFLLWRARPKFQHGMIDLLWPLVTRVVCDSTLQSSTLEALPVLLERTPGRDITDLSWTKITGWRELVARAFDTPDNADQLHRLRRIEIRHVGASEAQARLLAGWLISRTGTHPEVVLVPESRTDMKSGSLSCVRLHCGDEEYLIERIDEGIARIDAPRIATQNQRLRVPHLEELIAQELEVFQADEVYEQAVQELP
jgi:glucose-6-phosphate dehydrogenase assembly protein OpcA